MTSLERAVEESMIQFHLGMLLCKVGMWNQGMALLTNSYEMLFQCYDIKAYALDELVIKYSNLLREVKQNVGSEDARRQPGG